MQSQENDCPCENYCGGLWLGMNYSSFSGDDWTIMIGWITDHFLVDLGYSFESSFIHLSKSSFTLHELRSHLGLRYRINSSNLHLTCRLSGSYGIRSKKTSTRISPYEVGIFTGLDYQLSRHFLLSGKILPYNYERSFNRNRHHRVFAEGSITFAYVF